MKSLDSEDRATFMDAMKDITYGLNSNIQAIMAIPSSQMSDDVKTDLIAQLQIQVRDQGDMIASVFNQDLDWGDYVESLTMPEVEEEPEPETPAPSIDNVIGGGNYQDDFFYGP